VQVQLLTILLMNYSYFESVGKDHEMVRLDGVRADSGGRGGGDLRNLLVAIF